MAEARGALVTLAALAGVVLATACEGRPPEVPPAPITPVALPAASAPAPTTPPPPPPPRRRLSSWSLPARGGGACQVDEGVVTIVAIFATWCEPCKKQLPALQTMAKRLGAEVALVGISVDDEDDHLEEYATSRGLRFPMCWDKGHALAEKLQPQTMPTTYLFGKDGAKAHTHEGYQLGEEREIEGEVRALLGR